MKLGFHDSEETFEDAIKINRCIEFLYKRKHYWIDITTVDGLPKRAIWCNEQILSTYDNADDFLQNANINGVPIKEVIDQSKILSY